MTWGPYARGHNIFMSMHAGKKLVRKWFVFLLLSWASNSATRPRLRSSHQSSSRSACVISLWRSSGAWVPPLGSSWPQHWGLWATSASWVWAGEDPSSCFSLSDSYLVKLKKLLYYYLQFFTLSFDMLMLKESQELQWHFFLIVL